MPTSPPVTTTPPSTAPPPPPPPPVRSATSAPPAGPAWPRPGAAGIRPAPTRATAHLPARERLPEIVGGIGVVLVLVAAAGFVASQWQQVGDVPRAMLLGFAAAGLSAGGAWVDGRESRSRGLRAVVALVLAAATALVAGAVTLAAAALLPGHGRVAIALGGAAALGHAVVAWNTRREQLTPQVALFAAALYAAGPWGSALSDSFRELQLAELWRPLEGVFDPTVTSDAFVLTALLHLGVAAAWVGVHRLTSGPAQRLAAGLALLAATSAAVQANVHPSAVGAVVALGIVVATFAWAIADEDGLLVVGSAVGLVFCGVRVLAAVFTGKVLATVLLLLVGLALLAWAVRAASTRDDATRSTGR